MVEGPCVKHSRRQNGRAGVREGPCVKHSRRQNDFPPAGTAPAYSTKSSHLLWLILALSLFFPRVNFGKSSRLIYINPV